VSNEASQKIIPIAIEDTMRKSFIDYSMSVIIGRALPDVRDGLKPVHRRILYAMYDEGLLHNHKHSKCAGVVGEVLKKYHPHGDSSVYDALVRLAQPWSLRYLLVDGQGNFGSVDGDPPAAYRYTEARLTALAEEMLVDIDKETVPWKLNFDDSKMEPVILPSKIPNLLLNGSSGIAVGMATNIPPHNFRELAKGITKLIDNPEVSVLELMEDIQGPDFPTGGIICGQPGILQAYKTGRGSIILRCRVEVEQEKERERIIVSEIPYQVNKSVLLKDIAARVNNKEITGISDLRDESDKDGMRIVIELKRGEIAQVVLNQLYKHTSLQISFSFNMLAIKEGRPKMMGLKEMLSDWIAHRKTIIIAAIRFDMAKASLRAHILEGFKIALANLDAVIQLIKNALNREEARVGLQQKYALSETQANAILEMRLYQITALEASKLEVEYQELLKKIEHYKSLLANEDKILDIIKKDTTELAKKYGDERRSTLEATEGDFSAEDLIADEPCIITISHAGYIKRVPTDTYKAQKRGGRGVTAMDTKDEDYVEHVYTANTHDTMMIFTQNGMLHWLKVYAIPEATRVSRGKAIANLLQIPSEDKVAGFIPVRQFDTHRSIMMTTQKGIIKKASLALFSNIRKKGIIAITVRESDKLIAACLSETGDHILLSTEQGQTIRFEETEVTSVGRTAAGVIGIRLEENDNVVGMDIIKSSEAPHATLLVLCKNGYGKRSELAEFRKTGRAGKGIIAIQTSDRNGIVVAARIVKEDEDVMLITQGGMMVRTNVKSISIVGRNTQGVRVINLKDTDFLISMTPIEKEESQPETV
jgi:DNA gyrase subunit A